MLKKFKSIENEDGAIAVIFAIITSLVVVGLLALVIDVSALYAERRVVQNAADSAVLATAQECATSGTGAIDGSGAYGSNVCANQIYVKEFAGRYANLNSPDSLTDVSEVCGSSPLNSCASLTSGKYECHNVDSKYPTYVRVKTSTRQSSGTGIESIFGAASGASSSTTVVGCAQAAWGIAASAPVIMPIALSVCDWQLTGANSLVNFDPTAPTVQCSIKNLSGNFSTHGSTTNGFNVISNLGCPGIGTPPQVKLGDVVHIATTGPELNQVAGTCAEFQAQLSNLINAKVFFPLVECQSNCDANNSYEVLGFLGFKYTGSKWMGVTHGTNSNWPSACDATRICLYGTFERSVVPGADISLDAGTPDIGALAVQLLP